jgi:hypothetical protein
MRKSVDFDVWYQENEKVLNNLLEDVFKSLNALNIPQSFHLDFCFDDKTEDSLLHYIYSNSSSAYR